mgnify:CR=1 FL=1
MLLAGLWVQGPTFQKRKHGTISCVQQGSHAVKDTAHIYQTPAIAGWLAAVLQ